MLAAFLCSLGLGVYSSHAQTVFINEIHYDNASTDTNEGIEVAGPAGTDLSQYALVLYNGSNGSVYNTVALSGTISSQDDGYGTAFFAISGIQNGAPDGVALVQDTTVIQFLSYEGSFTAVGGAADGMLSTDIVVSETSSTPEGFSLQLVGSGSEYSDFTWAAEDSSSYDLVNAAQNFVSATPESIVFINEIHYDNASTDEGEGIELAGTAGTDLTDWSLVLYNGSNGLVYNTVSLSGVFADQSNGYGFFTFYISGIQNGAPDGVALVNAEDTVVQFLSYEGTLTAADGPAVGMESTDIGIAETSSTLVGNSLQLTGAGFYFEDFTWVESANTFDAINIDQIFGTPADTTGGDTTVVDPPVVADLWINEIHYDNASTDVDEGIEIAGTAGIDLSGYSLVLYNGNGGAVYNTVSLSGTIPSQQSGFGTIFFAISGLQNGSPDGVALVSPSNEVIQFLSYEGSMTAVGGAADGMTSEDIMVVEGSSTAAGFSLQLQGTGSAYADFTWAADVASTYDAVNDGQTFIPAAEYAFINEIHYDNASSDVGEAIEVAGTAGLDLAGWSLVLYNGNGGASYGTTSLSGIIPNQQNGFGTLAFAISGIQNGAPDGVALVNAEDTVIQFVSYEGSFVAADGPATGMTSEDIGVAETSSTPAGYSLQLIGTGFAYADFTWSDAIAETFGAINTGQSFGSGGVDPGPGSDSLVLVTIAEARAKSLGDSVIIAGILTATDQFAGPAYIQDSTGGIAIYDALVHGAGAFQIGDEIQIQGVLSEFGQMLQVTALTSLDTLSSGNSVYADTLTISELAAHEGELVAVAGVTFADGGLFYPGSNYDISDGTGSTQIRIDAEVESLIGKLKPQGVTTVTGVVGSYNGVIQLLPRFEADVPDAQDYTPGGSNVSTDSTLDIVTWNMEFFGSTLTNYGPSDVILQMENAIAVIEALDADIIAVQEVSDTGLLDALVDSLGNYARVCSDVYSYSFEPADPNFPAQQLCFIYNTNTVTITDEKVLFEQFYTDARTGVTTDLSDYPTGSASSFWASGRLPYMVTAEVNIQGVPATVKLVNIHAKSGGGSSDIARKTYDAQALKDTLDAYYSNDMVVVLGDYNDDVDVSIGGGTTPYEPFVIDSASYTPVTSVLSDAGFRSYVFSDNMIDHITITDELYEPYIDNSVYTFIPFSLIDNYSGTTSDHLPVVSRFDLFQIVDPLVLTAGMEDVSLTKGYNEEVLYLSPVVSGGLQPFTYLWSDGSTDSVYQMTVDYPDSLLSVTVTDAIGQTVSDVIVVSINDVTCSRRGRNNTPGVEMCNGQVTLCVQPHFVDHFLGKGWTIGECENTVRRSCNATNNPWSSTQKLMFDFSDDLVVGVTVYDFFGNVVSTNEVQVAAGTSEYSVSLPYKGVFYTKVIGEDGSFSASFVMVRAF